MTRNTLTKERGREGLLSHSSIQQRNDVFPKLQRQSYSTTIVFGDSSHEHDVCSLDSASTVDATIRFLEELRDCTRLVDLSHDSVHQTQLHPFESLISYTSLISKGSSNESASEGKFSNSQGIHDLKSEQHDFDQLSDDSLSGSPHVQKETFGVQNTQAAILSHCETILRRIC